ncbi:MAG: hypothetical protein H0W84_12170 [Bacteroidetes bacterium]|nr:hypothetical protein [Bacteroidota bacterium]
MRVTKIFVLFFLTIIFTAFFPPQKKVSLLVAEYDDNAAKNHLQHLVNYNFIDGAMVSKETLLSIPTQKEGVKGNYVRFDLGKNKIYRNRYIVTGIGNVIDIQTKKLLAAEQATFVAFNGDSIIFYTNDIFKGKYFSVLNLKTENYQIVKDPNYNPLPRPDVEVDETTSPYSISAYHITGKKMVLVNDAGHGESQPLVGDDVKRKFPIFWLDHKSFLYANFSRDQQSACIYKVSLDKTIEKIADITAIPSTAENTYFEFSNDGNIIYSCGKGRYLVDIKNRKADKILYESVGNNFSVESEENPKYGRSIRFEDKEAGKKWCRADNAKTTNGYAAFQNEIVIGTEHYPQGVAVWNSTTQKWTSLEVTSIADIIGWVEE